LRGQATPSLATPKPVSLRDGFFSWSRVPSSRGSSPPGRTNPSLAARNLITKGNPLVYSPALHRTVCGAHLPCRPPALRLRLGAGASVAPACRYSRHERWRAVPRRVVAFVFDSPRLNGRGRGAPRCEGPWGSRRAARAGPAR
jgi:hypothetical protein